SRFLRYLLGAEPHLAHPGFGQRWVRESLQVHTGDLAPIRGLLWHLAPDTAPVQDIWAHYGFTGTGMWICPHMGRWAVLMSNKVYYCRERDPLNEVRDAFRQQLFG
ncbi:serine hydrolase, partial [Streptomyces sp. NPDC020800]